MATSPLLLGSNGAASSVSVVQGTVLGVAKMGTGIAAPALGTVAAPLAGLALPISASKIAAVLAAGLELEVSAVLPWFFMGSTATFATLFIYEDNAPRLSEAVNVPALGAQTLRVTDTFIPAAGGHTYTVHGLVGAVSAGNSVYVQLPPHATPAVPILTVKAV